MNDEQYEDPLAPFERAARIYCSKVGIDPDAPAVECRIEMIGVAIPPMWRKHAPRLLDLSLMLTALREAAKPPEVMSS